jgi:hypothetical protein
MKDGLLEVSLACRYDAERNTGFGEAHRCALTWRLDSGVPDAQVAAWAGHSSRCSAASTRAAP